MLSKVYIFDIRDNTLSPIRRRRRVVNCFQKFISLIFETTIIFFIVMYILLWIAFKSLYLWYSRQLGCRSLDWPLRCELLSKVYIFDIRDNRASGSFRKERVVNCFQKFISLIFETTIEFMSQEAIKLWIAFKSLYLWYSRQRAMWDDAKRGGCELLSKVYIFDIRDNNSYIWERWELVVNCFQKFISLIFETTENNKI